MIIHTDDCIDYNTDNKQFECICNNHFEKADEEYKPQPAFGWFKKKEESLPQQQILNIIRRKKEIVNHIVNKEDFSIVHANRLLQEIINEIEDINIPVPREDERNKPVNQETGVIEHSSSGKQDIINEHKKKGCCTIDKGSCSEIEAEVKYTEQKVIKHYQMLLEQEQKYRAELHNENLLLKKQLRNIDKRGKK